MTTIEKIQQIIADEFGRGDVTDTTTLDQLAIDSLELINLMQALEEEFDIEIRDEQFPELTDTIWDLAQLVDQKADRT